MKKDQKTEKKKSIFGGIENAISSAPRRYLLPGMYTLKILACKEGTTRPPANENYFAADFEIIESDNPEFKKGGYANLYISTSWETGFSQIRHFLAAVMDEDFDDIGEQEADESVTVEQPLVGNIVKCEAWNIIKDDGSPFTKLRWEVCTT